MKCFSLVSGLSTAPQKALVKVINNLLIAADTGHVSILMLLDITAAFDTVCHNALLKRLETLLGITGTPLTWFRSYLTAREQFFSIGNNRSPSSLLSHGVPQGSVLGSLLFVIYSTSSLLVTSYVSMV